MVGSDGGDPGGSPSVDEMLRIARRLHRNLRVYRRSDSDEYHWDDWDSEAVAVAYAEVLRKRPELWQRLVHDAQESRLARRVLQLLVADLAEHSWTDLLIDPVQENRPGEKLRFSPLFETMRALATGEIRAPTKRGPDPAALAWRNLSIFFAVSELKDVGLPEPNAREYVGGEVGLGKERVGQICRKLARAQRRVRRRKR